MVKSKTSLRRPADRWRLIAVGLLFTGVFLALWLLPLDIWLQQLRSWLQTNPVSGSALFVAGFALGSAMLVPGSILIMSGGFLFGFVHGFVLVAVGTAVGASLSAVLSRYLLRDFLHQHFSANATFRALDAAIVSKGFIIVVLTRLSLLIPYNILNFMYGLTRVSIPILATATFIGMLPAVALYVYLGTLVQDAGALFAGGRDSGNAGVWLAAVGVVSLIAVTLIIHRTATRALRSELEKSAASAGQNTV